MIPDHYNHYRFSRRELERYFLVSGTILFLSAYVFYRNVIAAGIFGLFCIGGLSFYRRMQVDRRKNLLRLQFKDFLYSVSSSVTAGRQLPEAIRDAYPSVCLIHGEGSLLALELRNMIRQMEEANSSDAAVLQDLAARSDIREISDFTDVCLICRTTGGDLNRMITRAVAMLSENIEIQKEKEVLMAQKKLEARILAVMPVLVAGLINLSSSDYLDVMYTTILGRILMTVAFAGTVASYLWSLKLTYTEGQVDA